MVLVWNAVVLHERSSRESAVPAADDTVRALTRLVFAAAALVIFIGTVVTAAGPHAGDEQAARLNLVIGDVARLHGVAVWILLALTLVLARATREAPRVRRATTILLAALVVQGAVGYTQYFTGVPAVLVGVHVAGAIAVWWAATHVLLSVHAPVPLAVDARSLARTG
jgi:cytochrome c oxidase assembly protein subunit 15